MSLLVLSRDTSLESNIAVPLLVHENHLSHLDYDTGKLIPYRCYLSLVIVVRTELNRLPQDGFLGLLVSCDGWFLA
jgi:hypothetical protein